MPLAHLVADLLDRIAVAPLRRPPGEGPAPGQPWPLLVAAMSHGIAVHPCKSLKRNGIVCDILQHESDGREFMKCLILLATPAGFLAGFVRCLGRLTAGTGTEKCAALYLFVRP
jgi:hypothetical protein